MTTCFPGGNDGVLLRNLVETRLEMPARDPHLAHKWAVLNHNLYYFSKTVVKNTRLGQKTTNVSVSQFRIWSVRSTVQSVHCTHNTELRIRALVKVKILYCTPYTTNYGLELELTLALPKMKTLWKKKQWKKKHSWLAKLNSYMTTTSM
jgi:hypothetical protein